MEAPERYHTPGAFPSSAKASEQYQALRPLLGSGA
jgi:hypothetical protein